MHGGFATIDPVRDVPFVARHARHARSEVREACGLPADAAVALVSFGGYGVKDMNLAGLDCLDRVVVLVTHDGTFDGPGPDGVVLVAEPDIYGRGLRYEDVVAAVDVVITKPGYGIISECVANDTGLCTPRAAGSSNTTSWSARCRATCAAGSSIMPISSPAAGAPRSTASCRRHRRRRIPPRMARNSSPG